MKVRFSTISFLSGSALPSALRVANFQNKKDSIKESLWDQGSALRQLHVITSNFDWFTVLSVFFVIGWSNYFGFGFTTLK